MLYLSQNTTRMIGLLCILIFTRCAYSNQNFKIFQDKTIVILGGTGYLGRALTTEILKYNPKMIHIFSRDEVKHFHLMNHFDHHSKIQCTIGDIRDYKSVLNVTQSADVVLHAAALKRIDLIESNVEESIKTNILGSINVFNACVANNVKQAVFISTDKACAPVNTYGACKFVSEKLFTNYDQQAIATKFVVARYGNVLESTGSLIPIVLKRIKSGQDLLLTDPRMTRFIIDKNEAVQLIFDALHYGCGGEIFIKNLPAFNVVDVLETLKNKFQANNRIVTVGIRPGEKIHETLISEDELPRTIQFGKYFIITPTVSTRFQHSKTPPLYLANGKPATLYLNGKFSSDQTVMPRKDLVSLWEQLDSITLAC